MTEMHDNQTIKSALDVCASEPVHIPGAIQPIGWLLAYESGSGALRYASENIDELLGPPAEIFGTHLSELMGQETWHDIQNALSLSRIPRRLPAGIWQKAERSFYVNCWSSGDFIVVELEEKVETGPRQIDLIRQQTLMLNLLRDAQDRQELLDLVTRYLRRITQFDRVMIYQFDQDWNGVILCEARKPTMLPFVGLHFPSWDIPAQAREIMARLPLRLISDVDQTSMPLLAQSESLPPLDISLGETRGVSPVHMQYLRNMGAAATMTLSIVVGGRLWGMISFHHETPHVVPTQTRQVLTEILSVFCIKLEVLIQQNAIALSNRLEDLMEDLHGQINSAEDLDTLLQNAGSELCTALGGVGLAVKSGDQVFEYGQVPEHPAILALADHAGRASNNNFSTDCLADILPNEVAWLRGLAGAYVIRNEENWALMVFRPEIVQEVAWAGDPAKEIELVEGNARLNPRGSFTTYLTKVQGKSAPWESDTLSLARKLWPLLSVALAAEKRLQYMSAMDTQRRLMIDELNHRVRNILALVKSVSRQALENDSSLDSYSAAIEYRIKALAAAHKLVEEKSSGPVPLSPLLEQQIAPYKSANFKRMKMHGPNVFLAPKYASLMTLVIHELATNSVKYGALAHAKGWIDVKWTWQDNAVELIWKERDGLPVTAPERNGFGTTLILNAVPYELQGTSELLFQPDGLLARLTLPHKLFEKDFVPEQGAESMVDRTAQVARLPESVVQGQVLIVEDNFMIAEDLRNELLLAGCQSVECAGSVTEAYDLINAVHPAVTVLDVNLGEGQTSKPVAAVLYSLDLPFVFVTGYAEARVSTPELARAPVLTKPIVTQDLIAAISEAVAQTRRAKRKRG